jgi:hypothetical protein
VAISVNIDSVTAPDAVAGTAPHKMSAKATKNSVTFKFTPTATGPIRAWRARLAPTNRNTGVLLGKRGMVCGSGDRCGESTALSLVMASGTQVTEDATYPEATKSGAKADGAYQVKVYAVSAEDGWST